MNHNLTGRSIDAFLALEETRRFVLAAKRCHVSPSTFSQMISRLEDQVGAKLFDRDTRNVSLTPEGVIFSFGAHRISAEIKSSLAELMDRASFSKGRVTVATTPSLAADWMPRRLAEFRNLYPEIDLRIHDVTTERCMEMVRRNEADFGVSAQPGSDEEFDNILLFKERYYLICPEDDPIAKETTIKLSGLKNRNFVHMVRTGTVRQQMMPLLTAAKVGDSGMEVGNFGSLAGLVTAKFGLGIVPEHAVQLCHRSGLVARPLQSPRAVWPIIMTRRKGFSMSVAASAFWKQLEKTKNSKK